MCSPLFVKTRVVLESLHAGMGHTHVNYLLSTLNVHTTSHKTYKVRDREVGCCVEFIVGESCKNVTCEEKITMLRMKKGMLKWLYLTTWGGKNKAKDIFHLLGMVQ